MPLVPKKLHAIWLGGVLTEVGKRNIENWCKTNPDYVMNVWIDSSTYYKPDSEIYAKQQLELEEFKSWACLNKISINDINSSPPSQNLIWNNRADIFTGMLSKNYYRDELQDPGTNLAAASDTLRVDILCKEGGVYFDAEDVFPDEPLGSLEVSDEEGILINVKSQSTVNNNLIASIPGGVTITSYRESIFERYEELFQKDKRYLVAHRYQHLSTFRTKKWNRFESTMYLTGPYLLHQIVGEKPEPQLHFPEKMWREPDSTALSWVDLKGQDHEKFAELFRLTLIEYFNLLIEKQGTHEVLQKFKEQINDAGYEKPMTQLVAKVKRLFTYQELVLLDKPIRKLLNRFNDYSEQAERFLLYCKWGEIDLNRLWNFIEQKSFYYSELAKFACAANPLTILYFFNNQFMSESFKLISMVDQEKVDSYSAEDRKNLEERVSLEMAKLSFEKDLLGHFQFWSAANVVNNDPCSLLKEINVAKVNSILAS
jgi:hypothetical protein